MPNLFDIGSVARDVVDSVSDAADQLFTSDEERKKADRLLRKVEVKLEEKMLEVKKQVIRQRGAAVTAEIQGESWLQRSWRPITMLSFVAVIGAHWLGLAGQELPPELAGRLYSLVKLGLGGYVIGRSAEKIAPHARDAITQGTQTEKDPA
jgi:hypothetical protein